MPLFRRLPKRGFKSVQKKKIAIINLNGLQNIFKKNQSLTKSKINLLALQKSKIIGKKYKKLKLLGSGEIKEKIDFEVNFISESAKKKVEKAGGKIILIK